MKNKWIKIISILLVVMCLFSNTVMAECNANDGNDSESDTETSFIYYMKNDGTDDYTKQNFTDNEDTLLDSDNLPTREGYTFINWNTHADGSGYTFAFKGDDDEISVAIGGKEIVGTTYNAVKRDANLTLYAQWDQLTLTYDANDGSNYIYEVTVDRNDGSIVLFDNYISEEDEYIFDPVDNYEFVGWNTKEDGSGTSYSAGDTFQITYDVSLYAQWRQINYTVSFDANGGSLPEGTVNPVTNTDGKLPSSFPTPTKEDCTFGGWYLDDGFINVATVGEDITGDVTLYAKWITNYVASINGTSYTSSEFLNAYSSISGDVSVTLLGDVNLGSNTFNIVAGKNVTLDLNGYSISSSNDTIDITGGNLTINDSSNGEGKVVSGRNALYCLNKTDTPINITINGGCFEASRWAFYINYDNNNKVCNKVTINSNVGEFKSTSTRDYGALRIACPGVYQIKGGTYSGKKSLSIKGTQKLDDDFEMDTLYADVHISGGTFNNAINYSADYISVTGGRFAFNAYIGCERGYTSEEDNEGYYIVEKDSEASNVAKIGDVEYCNLQEAIDTATNGQTIVLIADDDEKIIISEDKNITLDLNGHKLGSEDTTGNIVLNYGVLNIENSDVEHISYIVCETNSVDVCINNVGTLTVGNKIRLSGYFNIYNIGNLNYSALWYGSAYGLYMDKGKATILGGNLGGTIAAYVKGGTLTINGGNAFSTSDIAIRTFNDSKVIINGGSVYSNVNAAIDMNDNSEVTINGGTIYSENKYAIGTFNKSKLTINGENTSIYTTKDKCAALYIANDSKVIMNDGLIKSYKYSGIYINNNATLEINGGTIQGSTSGIAVDDCDLLTINDGTIDGNNGLYIYWGDVAVKGGNISSTNDAIVVDAIDVSDDQNIVLNISDGNINSKDGYAIKAINASSIEHQEVPLITITGGLFKSATDKQTIVQAEDFEGTLNISGGYYSNTFDDCFLKEGYEFKDNGEAETKVSFPYFVDKTAWAIALDKIEAIGDVSYSSSCKARIDAARLAYNALSNEEKAKISSTQYKILTDAEDNYDWCVRHAYDDLFVVTPTETKKSTTTKKTIVEGTKVISDTEKLITKADGSSTRQIVSKDNEEIQIVSDSKIIPTGTVLSHQEVEKDSDEYVVVQEAIDENDDLKNCDELFVYNFNLTQDNGVEIHELDGYVEVSLPLPKNIQIQEGQKLVVYRVNEDGTLTKCDCEVKEGVITFKTNHFSTFIFVVEGEKLEENANNNEVVDVVVEESANNVVLPLTIIGILLLVVIVVAVIVVKRRKNN